MVNIRFSETISTNFEQKIHKRLGQISEKREN